MGSSVGIPHNQAGNQRANLVLFICNLASRRRGNYYGNMKGRGWYFAWIPGACLLLFQTAGADDQSPNEWKFSEEELLRNYEGKGEPPRWRYAVKDVLSGSKDQAASAARFLIDLSEHAFADEVSGRVGWYSTPCWEVEGMNIARKVREDVIETLAFATEEHDSQDSAELVPVLDWFIRKEIVLKYRTAAMRVLLKQDGKEADALVGSIAGDETIPHALTTMALQRATGLGLQLPEPTLLAALADHHADRRTAAAGHWKNQFGSEPPVRFDPVIAVQSPALREMLERFGKLMIDQLPADAPMVLVEESWKKRPKSGPENDVELSIGWLIKREGNDLRILDLQGRVCDFKLGDNPVEDWKGFSTVKFRELPIAELVSQIESGRKNEDPEIKISVEKSLPAQFQGPSEGVPEMLLAMQLHRTRKLDLCARILLPALDSHPEDKVFFEVAKHRLAAIYAYRMLVEFVGNRDYNKSLAIAARIERDLGDTEFHSWARRLLAELPKRMDDFHGLSLPTRQEWDTWKANHNREEQIRFLCSRLRLMNCYQYGQPADVEWFDIQYAEPCGILEDATLGLGLGKTRVINPLEELLGNSEPRSNQEDDDGNKIPLPPIPGMNLGIRDVPVIAPFLREDNWILSVGFWRTFHPSRTMTSTRELLACLLKESAKRELVDEREWSKLDDTQISEKIDAMIAWAKVRSDKSETELLLVRRS